MGPAPCRPFAGRRGRQGPLQLCKASGRMAEIGSLVRAANSRQGRDAYGSRRRRHGRGQARDGAKRLKYLEARHRVLGPAAASYRLEGGAGPYGPRVPWDDVRFLLGDGRPGPLSRRCPTLRPSGQRSSRLIIKAYNKINKKCIFGSYGEPLTFSSGVLWPRPPRPRPRQCRRPRT